MLQIIGKESIKMGEKRSLVPQLIAEKGWTNAQFVRALFIAGLSQQTAYRVARGDPNMTVDTLLVVAQVLGVSIDKLVISN